MTLNLDDLPEGATPLSREDIAGLIPLATTRAELDNLEQANIVSAERWAFRSRTLKRDLISTHALRLLHRKMFGQVWEWAGEFRQVQTNIGVASYQIPVELHNLCKNVSLWVKEGTYPIVEIGVRFHHRLVWIHPFPNGNGRHARLAADLLVTFQAGHRLSWGSENLTTMSEARRMYLDALRKADRHDFSDLLAFASG